ncbi:preprotein translocase subunit SecG [Candidatus Poribacteria bacterium]|nr:MAG: preprotein translocase subunit SecG [Candidatus Poribacteria bacterium]
MGIIIGFVLVVFVPLCVVLTLVILLQDSKGEGLSSSAFGGAEMQSVLGGRGAATFLSKMTTWLAIGFMLISLFLMRFYGEEQSGALTPIEQETTQEATVEATAEPVDTIGEEGVETATDGAGGETTDDSSKTEIDGTSE